jgi:uncharacterized protein (TIGR02231 family)
LNDFWPSLYLSSNSNDKDMKRIFACLAFVAGTGTSLLATEKEIIKSTISEVTVYTQGAQVYRKASYTVKPGITEIIIDGICPTIDAKSLQVKASGNIVILDSKYSLFYPQPTAAKSLDGLPLKIRKDIFILEDSLLVLNYEVQEIQDEIDVLNATKNILSNNGAIRGQGKVNDSIQLLKQAVEYYATKMNELNKQLLKLNRRKAEKNVRKADMQSRLNTLKNYQSNAQLDAEEKGPIHRVTITVSSKEIVSGKISFSYLVSQAGWTPLYDLRSEITTGKVNLNYKAQVYQNTGINWEDVRLTISTNNPYQNKTKPTLHPWYIDYYTRPVYKSDGYSNVPAPAAAYEKKSRMDTDSESKEEEVSYNAQTAAAFSTMVDNVISAEFHIDLPYTILSNNEQHMVLISNKDLTASFKYYTVPKIDASVYLVAQISKLDELQLVPAKANIFFDGSYIGETYLDPSTMDDTLSLSLGRDPNLIVKRTLLKKESKEKIIGAQKEKINSYEIEIRNQKSVNATIVIQDQVPVTQNADITIESVDAGKARYNETTGLLEWEISLKPKESKTINFGYKVKFSKDQNITFN